MRLILIFIFIAITTNSISFSFPSFPLSSNPRAFSFFKKALYKDNRAKQCAPSFFTELFDDKKFTIESHEVTTQDGYILTLFRVNLKNKPINFFEGNAKKVILLQHGLQDSADGWFVNGENGSVGFHILNSGYDVWVGNNRGSKYSLRHVNDKQSTYDFWDFSWDEMALYDVPANYKYILKHTGVDQISYLGHSEGTSQFFAAGVDYRTKDFITKHTKKFVAQAPIVYLKHCGSSVLQFTSLFSNLLEPNIRLFGAYHWFPSLCSEEPKWTALLQYFCDKIPAVCDSIIPGIKIGRKNDTIFDNISKLITHYPAGAGWKDFMKYAQTITVRMDEKFQMFDNGFFGNIMKYGQYAPPQWDIGLFEIDTALISGTLDELGNPMDVAMLSARMPLIRTKLYFLNEYDHVSFLFPRDPKKMFEAIDYELGITKIE